MNPFKYLLVCLVIGSLSGSLMAQGIEFQHGSWAEIQAKAAEADKPIFVDAFTTWCGPCKWMAANLFPDAAVGAYFNENFIPYKLDMEKGEGIEFAKTYRVKAYPSLIFVNGEGELLHKSIGTPRTPEGLIDVAKAATDPDQQLYSLKKQYEASPEDPALSRTYALALASAHEDGAEAIGMKYLTSIDPANWSQPENFEFITKIVSDFRSDAFLHVMNNKTDYLKANEAGQVEGWVNYVLQQAVYKAMDKDREVAMKNKVELASTYKELLDEADSKAAIARMEYNFARKYDGEDPEIVHNAAKAYFDKHVKSWQELNQISWNYYESMDDKVMLRDALRWANKSVEMDGNPMNMDTQAALLYKLGIYGEAKKVAEATIALAKEREEDASGTVELLKKIDAKLDTAPAKTR